MRVLVRLAADRLLLVLALLLYGVVLSQFFARTTVAAARVHVSETELQRSLARYRLLLEDDESRHDPVIQIQNLEIRPEQEEQKEIKTNAYHAVQENPEKKVDEIQAGVEFEGKNVDTIKIKQSNEKVRPEMTEEQMGDQLRQPDDKQRDSVEKTEETNLRIENQDEVTQQQIAEEVKSEEKNQEVFSIQDEVTQQHTQQQIVEEVKSEDKNQEVETAADEREHFPRIEEQQVQSEEQKQVEAEKTEFEPESNAENQQQGEIREETESNDEILEHHELREEPQEAKVNEQQTEEKEEVVSNAEDNNLAEWKESESKTEEKMTEDERESESNTEERKTDEMRTEESQSQTEETPPAEEEPFVFPEPYLLGQTIKDWDEQRGNWRNSNPHMNTTSDGNPRVLIVTGSQPNPCHSPVGDNFNLRSFKLKIDYARMHNYEIYYNFAWLDPLFGSYWVKLPILRNLMLTHPEIEWFFWIDSDAIFTDMIFEAPFHTYDFEGINMIMWGYHEGFYVQKSWVGFNAGVFIIRNCQWSLDMIDKWSPMGPDGPVRDEYGKILTSYLSNRPQNYPADDQSALAYLILTDESVKSKVKLVELRDYMISAWWVEVVDTYETSMEKYHPGLGDWRWPWITHFTGCGPCGGDCNSPDYQKCMKHIERALNFADNQVLAYMGFQHESLSSNSLLRTRNESDRPLEFLGVNPWEERIAEVAAAAA